MTEQEMIYQMYKALNTIANHYQTPQQLQKNSGKQYGLEYEEALEMSYENIQQVAKEGMRGIGTKTIEKYFPKLQSLETKTI